MQRLTVRFSALGVLIPVFVLARPAAAEVIVIDHGAQTSIARPGAPAHIVGLPRTTHSIDMDTGVRKYGLRYVIARDDQHPDVAIPGEGYIGMSQPASCNWYAGGFFDLHINGQSIGTTPIHSLVGRSAGTRGSVDFVFDTPASIVRIRFVTDAGQDALYCQTLLEPKTEIRELRVVLRCYPSAFVSNAKREVLTPLRDLSQGERAELDVTREWWLLYYDAVFDQGHVSPACTGVGPCSVLWQPSQTGKVAFTVGGYGIDTSMDLTPSLRDFRFVFLDYKGTKNEVAIADLRQRAEGLLRELADFVFVDQSIVTWPLARKQQDVAALLATMANDKVETEYRIWAEELAGYLELVRSGAPGAIMAEAAAASTIRKWEQRLPELKLEALLKGI